MVNSTNYSKSVMKAMMDVLPIGTMKEIEEKLKIPYTTVVNVCHGKQYKKEVVSEVERRFNAVKKALTEK